MHECKMFASGDRGRWLLLLSLAPENKTTSNSTVVSAALVRYEGDEQ